jgi:hypothetical protein
MHVLNRLLIAGLGMVLLIGCGAQAADSATPIPVAETVVETVVVTRVVEVPVEVTREVVVTATPLPPKPTPAATRTPTPPPVGGKWNVLTETSAFDDGPVVMLSLRAEQVVEGFLTTYRPILTLRCEEGVIEAFIVTGMAADVEFGNTGGATVRLRVDDAAAETTNTTRSTDDEALFFDNARPLIERLTAAERLLFGFTPFNASPVETWFDLRGLDEVVPQLYEACGV